MLLLSASSDQDTQHVELRNRAWGYLRRGQGSSAGNQAMQVQHQSVLFRGGETWWPLTVEGAWRESITLGTVFRWGVTFHTGSLIIVEEPLPLQNSRFSFHPFPRVTSQQRWNKAALLWGGHRIWNSRDRTITINRDSDHLHIKEGKLVTSDNPVLNN